MHFTDTYTHRHVPKAKALFQHSQLGVQDLAVALRHAVLCNGLLREFIASRLKSPILPPRHNGALLCDGCDEDCKTTIKLMKYH